MKIIVEGTPNEIAALTLELQGRHVDFDVSLDGREVTKSVLRAIRGRSADSTCSECLPY